MSEKLSAEALSDIRKYFVDERVDISHYPRPLIRDAVSLREDAIRCLLDHIAALEAELAQLREAVAAGDALADETHRTQVWLTSVQPIRLDNLQRAIDTYRAARQRDGEEG